MLRIFEIIKLLLIHADFIFYDSIFGQEKMLPTVTVNRQKSLQKM